MSDMLRLFRIAIREKETDKRKNATCHEYVAMATTLEGAKALAVAEHIGAADGAGWGHARLERIAAVGGHAMGLVYHSDIYGSRKKEERPETLPEEGTLLAARELIRAFEAAHADEEDQDQHPEELTKS